jgi:hypothetical protein
LRAQLGRQGLAEIVGLEHRADLDLAFLVVRIGAALDPVDRFLQRGDFPEPVAGDEFLGLGRRAVNWSAAG